MVGEYEADARRAAVEAVERRWARQNEQERKIASRSRLGNLLFILIAIAALYIALIFLAPHFGYMVPDLGIRGLLNISATASKDKANLALALQYHKIAESFKTGKPALWKDAPPAIRPKTARAGTVLHALIFGSAKSYDLYEIVATGDGKYTVSILSPFAKTSQIKMSEFLQARSGKLWFIANGGFVYACGKTTLKELDHVRKQLFNGATGKRQ